MSFTFQPLLTQQMVSPAGTHHHVSEKNKQLINIHDLFLTNDSQIRRMIGMVCCELW